MATDSKGLASSNAPRSGKQRRRADVCFGYWEGGYGCAVLGLSLSRSLQQTKDGTPWIGQQPLSWAFLTLLVVDISGCSFSTSSFCVTMCHDLTRILDIFDQMVWLKFRVSYPFKWAASLQLLFCCLFWVIFLGGRGGRRGAGAHCDYAFVALKSSRITKLPRCANKCFHGRRSQFH